VKPLKYRIILYYALHMVAAMTLVVIALLVEASLLRIKTIAMNVFVPFP